MQFRCKWNYFNEVIIVTHFRHFLQSFKIQSVSLEKNDFLVTNLRQFYYSKSTYYYYHCYVGLGVYFFVKIEENNRPRGRGVDQCILKSKFNHIAKIYITYNYFRMTIVPVAEWFKTICRGLQCGHSFRNTFFHNYIFEEKSFCLQAKLKCIWSVHLVGSEVLDFTNKCQLIKSTSYKRNLVLTKQKIYTWGRKNSLSDRNLAMSGIVHHRLHSDVICASV